MKKNKPTVDMMSSISQKSLVLKYTKVFNDLKVLVITTGYNKDGSYGYFLCWEEEHPQGYQYSDQIVYIKKTSDKSYQEALNILSNYLKTNNLPLD